MDQAWPSAKEKNQTLTFTFTLTERNDQDLQLEAGIWFWAAVHDEHFLVLVSEWNTITGESQPLPGYSDRFSQLSGTELYPIRFTRESPTAMSSCTL